MRLFAIDADNSITAFPAAEHVPEGQERFATEKELAKLAANWPADRVIQVWNSFAGVAPFDELKPVKKFTDRRTAVARVWKAIQRLDASPAPQAADVAPKGKRSRRTTNTEDGAPTAREGSKKSIVLDLLRRKDGATLAEIAKATDWQNHSIRGFISGTITKKMGLTIESIKNPAGERRYRLVP